MVSDPVKLATINISSENKKKGKGITNILVSSCIINKGGRDVGSDTNIEWRHL